MSDIFGVLYRTDGLLGREDGASFWGDAWCGPAVLPHWQETLIAKFTGTGDGQDVEVYCTAAPARFYRINIIPGSNSIGEPMEGHVLTTGTGQEDLVKAIAIAYSEGMLGIDRAKATGKAVGHA